MFGEFQDAAVSDLTTSSHSIELQCGNDDIPSDSSFIDRLNEEGRNNSCSCNEIDNIKLSNCAIENSNHHLFRFSNIVSIFKPAQIHLSSFN